MEINLVVAFSVFHETNTQMAFQLGNHNVNFVVVSPMFDVLRVNDRKGTLSVAIALIILFFTAIFRAND